MMILSRIKTYLIIISTVIAILAGGYGFFMKIRNDVLEMERDNARDELTVKTTETIRYKNELGQEVIKVLEYEVVINDLECSQDSLEREIYRTIQASKLKERQLTEAISVNIESKNKGVYDSVRYIFDTTIMALDGAREQLAELESKSTKEVRYFNDGFLALISYPDSLNYTYTENITLLKAHRLVDRKFFFWKWIGWKKMIDRDFIEIKSNNPNSQLDGRIIKLNN